MTTGEREAGIDVDFAAALADLREALARAGSAAERLQRIAPHLRLLTGALDDVAATLTRAGRLPAAAAAGAPAPSRPMPAVPGADDPNHADGAWAQLAESWRPAAGPAAPGPVTARAAGTGTLRIAFERASAPLDLRAVDAAVSAHPAVRDVALLDYDGHRATLNVWLEPAADVARVRADLIACAARLSAGADDVAAIALDEAA